MNLRRKVWLPPDGDSRLIRFQEALATEFSRLEWAAVPPYVHLEERNPHGPVVPGAWVLEAGVPVLEARDEAGLVGVFRFGLPGSPWSAQEFSRLPPPPSWKWERGRLAVLDLTIPRDDAVFALWSWESLTGWRSDRPKL